MIFHTFVSLSLAAAVSAAPALKIRELNSTKWTPDHILQPNEVILYGEGGRMEVVHEDVYHSLITDKGYLYDAPEVDEDFLGRIPPISNSTKSHHERDDCLHTTAVVADSETTFVDWDVQMSPVVIGTGTNGIDVYVSSGYTVTNSITVSASADWTVIKDKLGLSAGIDYTRSWSTATVINIKGTVSPGWSGVMITKPIKTRKYGRQLSGCIGSQTEDGTWMADSYEEGSYGGVSWVSGAITVDLVSSKLNYICVNQINAAPVVSLDFLAIYFSGGIRNSSPQSAARVVLAPCIYLWVLKIDCRVSLTIVLENLAIVGAEI
ncbi:hypothetical protein G7Z17_g2400 [Cylindrodendrum hubeiense]|uniref:Uncharacterized protein n=1 Tax=Cylindrodendrum hubeiense TaxID=595255 RepID=A0A9P5HHQ1_9HYPO|nr:hypothetical protein G7Z17_g2400 [Cylindrodendrum hubeiense]